MTGKKDPPSIHDAPTDPGEGPTGVDRDPRSRDETDPGAPEPTEVMAPDSEVERLLAALNRRAAAERAGPQVVARDSNGRANVAYSGTAKPVKRMTPRQPSPKVQIQLTRDAPTVVDVERALKRNRVKAASLLGLVVGGAGAALVGGWFLWRELPSGAPARALPTGTSPGLVATPTTARSLALGEDALSRAAPERTPRSAQAPSPGVEIARSASSEAAPAASPATTTPRASVDSPPAPPGGHTNRRAGAATRPVHGPSVRPAPTTTSVPTASGLAEEP